MIECRKMGVLSDLKPEGVFRYFEEISQIPRGSYHEKAISDYLTAFAKKHGFDYWQDALYNVVMKVPATKGREQESPLILQGHMDMVCEKKPGASIDMEQEGLQLAVEGDYVYAKDTTLGGDDGIAIAYMLAIADDDTISHPPLEYIMTVSEEVGMEGANGIDLSMLSGNQMLNLDSEEEGVFLTSCAGGLSMKTTLPVRYEGVDVPVWYEMKLTGLLGGHSGCEIDKGRANAALTLGRVLSQVANTMDIRLASLGGGKKDNAIPSEAEAVIGLMGEESTFLSAVRVMEQTLQAEYQKADPGLQLVVTKTAPKSQVLTKESQNVVLTLLMAMPDGIQGMSMSVPGLVETSLNLGIMELREEQLFLQQAIRSSVTSKKLHVANRIQCLVEAFGGTAIRQGEYPAWEYKEESVVRPRVIALYEELYGKKPVVEGIHAGLECGLLAGKIENLDCVAMGPDILDIHTPAERLSISSTKRVYDFLIAYLSKHL